jgi:hypothetical protein
MEASQHSLLAACFTLHSINATLAIVPQRGAGLWMYLQVLRLMASTAHKGRLQGIKRGNNFWSKGLKHAYSLWFIISRVEAYVVTINFEALLTHWHNVKEFSKALCFGMHTGQQLCIGKLVTSWISPGRTSAPSSGLKNKLSRKSVSKEVASSSACQLLSCWFLCSAYSSTLKMEAICSFGQQTTQRYIPDDSNLHNHHCENHKSYIVRSSTSGAPHILIYG